MITTEFCRIMARYNRWMNERMLDICARIPDEERRRDRGAFFKSIHGTWNHILLGDRAWLGRFTNKPFKFDYLGQELYHDFDEFRTERTKTDEAIIRWAETLDEEIFKGAVHLYQRG